MKDRNLQIHNLNEHQVGKPKEIHTEKFYNQTTESQRQ